MAVGFGLLAVAGVSQIMEQNNRGPNIATAPIYVALHNINVGDPIDSSMVSLQDWPKDKIPAGSISQLEDLEGRRPRTNIIAGETLLEAKLLKDGEHSDAISGIKPGMRLSTIAVDAEKSAAGLLSPGDRVDVQLYADRNERIGILEPVTKVILQDIRVFAIEAAVQRGVEEGEGRTIPKTVSLEVTPDQASRIDLAQNLGEITLIPRSPTDDVKAEVASITAGILLDLPGSKNSRELEQGLGLEQAVTPEITNQEFLPAADPVPTPTLAFQMEIIRAGERTTMDFDAVTGKPMLPLEDGSTRQTFGSRTRVAPPLAPSIAAPAAEPAAPAPVEQNLGEEEAFPINFGE